MGGQQQQVGNLPELIKELGYQFTGKPDVCRNQLVQLAGGELHAHTVARIIGVMIRTHTGLDDSATLQNMNATGKEQPPNKLKTTFLNFPFFPH